MTVLEARALCASAAGNKAQSHTLQDVSFALPPGSITGVIGPNGAGKSTLLRALCAELRPQSGQVLLAGRQLASWSPTERARALAVLPQHSQLSFPFSTEQVVALGRLPHATGAAIDKDVVQQAMLATDTDALAARKYTQLSGGEQQRVQLARVLAQLWRPVDSTTRLLLLDEPTAALDMQHQQQLFAALRQFRSEGGCCLLVMHDVNPLAALADSVLVLHHGQLIAAGTPAEVYRESLFETVFQTRVQVLQGAAQQPWVLPC